jgi:hypothetical membrane protein
LIFGFFIIIVWSIPWSSAAIPEVLSSMLDAIWIVYMAVNILK